MELWKRLAVIWWLDRWLFITGCCRTTAGQKSWRNVFRILRVFCICSMSGLADCLEEWSHVWSQVFRKQELLLQPILPLFHSYHHRKDFYSCLWLLVLLFAAQYLLQLRLEQQWRISVRILLEKHIYHDLVLLFCGSLAWLINCCCCACKICGCGSISRRCCCMAPSSMNLL